MNLNMVPAYRVSREEVDSPEGNVKLAIGGLWQADVTFDKRDNRRVLKSATGSGYNYILGEPPINPAEYVRILSLVNGVFTA